MYVYIYTRLTRCFSGYWLDRIHKHIHRSLPARWLTLLFRRSCAFFAFSSAELLGKAMEKIHSHYISIISSYWITNSIIINLTYRYIRYFILKKYRSYLLIQCKNSGWSCWSLWRNQVIQKIYLREAVASAEALSLFGDGVDGDGKAPFEQWKTMENNGKQWCFRCSSKKMITKNREWRDESSKKTGFTISKHHKNQKSIIVKKHWYSEHSHPWFPTSSHNDFPASQVLVSQLAALLSRAGLVFAEDRPGLFAGDAGTASHLHVDRKPLLQFCALEQKVADGLGKKKDILGQC